MSISYKDAGVDLDAAEASKSRIENLCKATFTDEVMAPIGVFGGFFDISRLPERQPVLVSSVDGVGTKVKVACALAKHDTVGMDLVNHCVNDIATGGARPLFFMDYLALGKMAPGVVEDLVAGVATACRENGCALVGGETAEMPDVYAEGEYDLAGTIVGVVDKDRMLDGSRIREKDVLVGLPSTGLHTNGYTLARKVLLEVGGLALTQMVTELGCTVGDEMMKVHRSYLSAVQVARLVPGLHALAHITGGGIEGNLRRLMHDDQLDLYINWDGWDRSPIFHLVQKTGEVAEEEMRRAFNLGIGFVFVVDNGDCEDLCGRLRAEGENPMIIGYIGRKY